MSGSQSARNDWVLVPGNYNAMLDHADREMRAIAENGAQDAARIARAKSHVTLADLPSGAVSTAAELEALAHAGAAFDKAEQAHDQAVARLAAAQAALAGSKGSEARHAALTAKAKLWRLALVVLLFLLVVWLLW